MWPTHASNDAACGSHMPPMMLHVAHTCIQRCWHLLQTGMHACRMPVCIWKATPVGCACACVWYVLHKARTHCQRYSRCNLGYCLVSSCGLSFLQFDQCALLLLSLLSVQDCIFRVSHFDLNCTNMHCCCCSCYPCRTIFFGYRVYFCWQCRISCSECSHDCTNHNLDMDTRVE